MLVDLFVVSRSGPKLDISMYAYFFRVNTIAAKLVLGNCC